MALRSLDDQLKLTQGRPSGFDYLRIILSVSVVAWHTILVLHGQPAERPYWTGLTRPFPFFILPSFFALSGFLVAGSLDRNDLPAFLTLRKIEAAREIATTRTRKIPRGTTTSNTSMMETTTMT